MDSSHTVEQIAMAMQNLWPVIALPTVMTLILGIAFSILKALYGPLSSIDASPSLKGPFMSYSADTADEQFPTRPSFELSPVEPSSIIDPNTCTWCGNYYDESKYQKNTCVHCGGKR